MPRQTVNEPTDANTFNKVAAPQAVQDAVPEAIEQMAIDRYKVVPSHESMFHRWAVVAGNGAQQLYIGREGECQSMARKFMGAFLDGAFVAVQNATPAHPAEGVPAQIETLRSELTEEKEAADNWRRLALQFDNHRLQALWHLKRILHEDSSVDEYKAAEQFLAAPPLDGQAVLAQRIAALAATQPAAQGMDAPWSDLKVAFDCDDTNALWAALDAGNLVFPRGWTLVETDGSCACSVAVFRVDHAPTPEEGSAVKAAIDAALAAQAAKQGERQ